MHPWLLHGTLFFDFELKRRIFPLWKMQLCPVFSVFLLPIKIQQVVFNIQVRNCCKLPGVETQLKASYPEKVSPGHLTFTRESYKLWSGSIKRIWKIDLVKIIWLFICKNCVLHKKSIFYAELLLFWFWYIHFYAVHIILIVIFQFQYKTFSSNNNRPYRIHYILIDFITSFINSFMILPIQIQDVVT